MHKPPRIKLPAQVRERVHRQATALARSHADMLIAALERQLSAELAAAVQSGQVQRQAPRTAALDAVGEMTLIPHIQRPVSRPMHRVRP